MIKKDEQAVKKRIVLVGLTLRLLIISSVVALTLQGGFLPSEQRYLLFLTLPISVFYISLFLKYIIKNAYKYPDPAVAYKPYKVAMGYRALLLLNIAEFGPILYKALYGKPSIHDLTSYILIIETAFGALAGLYISSLFSEKPRH